MKTERRFTTTDAEITNQCTCTEYDPITGEYTDEPAEHCDGLCWEFAIEDWVNTTAEFVGDGGDFVIDGFPLWDRTVIGFASALDPKELLAAITVRGDWRIRYSVGPDALVATIWHHDVPTGGTFTVVREDDDTCTCEIAFSGHCDACRDLEVAI